MKQILRELDEICHATCTVKYYLTARANKKDWLFENWEYATKVDTFYMYSLNLECYF